MSSSIKKNKGICIDCPPGSGEKYLTAKRCPDHYWRYRSEVNKKKPSNKAKAAVKSVVGAYMASDAIKFPVFCEETGQRLPTSPLWMRNACKAHILKKRSDVGFPSVAIHPKNMIFLMPDIHSNMDNFGREYILKMKSLPLMRERVQILLPLLTPEELNRVPDYFL